MTVHSILEKCNLPTSYIDSLPSETKRYPFPTFTSIRNETRERSSDFDNVDLKDMGNEIFRKDISQESLR